MWYHLCCYINKSSHFANTEVAKQNYLDQRNCTTGKVFVVHNLGSIPKTIYGLVSPTRSNHCDKIQEQALSIDLFWNKRK